MTLDTFNTILNPAKWPAIQHAESLARSTRKPVKVYVGPPGSGCMNGDGKGSTAENIWFVRMASEPAPDKAQLAYKVIALGDGTLLTQDAANMKTTRLNQDGSEVGR
jgi:hypothetical protein